MKNFYNKSKNEIFSQFETSENGLSDSQVEQRLQEHGKNKLEEAKKANIFKKFIYQFKDILILILLASSIISLFLGEYIDSIVIFIVILANAFVGVIQENKAENAMQSLKSLTKPYCKVVRNGAVTKIETENLVIGDIVLLEAGDFVPADLRIIECNSLKTVESSLTGESVPVEKVSYVISGENLQIADQTNMAFMGTSVSYGRATGVVVKTANSTEMGKIAKQLNVKGNKKTPLQQRVDKTSKALSVLILILCLVIFAVGLIRNPNNFVQCFMVAISIAVCAVPEGLPTGITVAMSIGVYNMSKRKAIVKQLSSVETLGSTQIICSDKTGTLTLNKMTVKEVFVKNMDSHKLEENPNHSQLLNAMLLCNDTKIKFENNNLITIGDPTETALVYYSQIYNLNKENLDGMYPRINEIPFDSERKLMSTVHSINNEHIVYTKGAVDCLLNKCSHILDNGIARKITEQDKQIILDKNTDFADKALRVLGFALKNLSGDVYNLDSSTENDLTFIGLCGMIDPPREEVEESIKTCKEAGIKVIMITGDHKNTAYAIAKQIGIADKKSKVMSGDEIDKLSDEEFKEKIKNICVFARVSPEHKLKIVQTLKNLNYVVAMTGDGVNDAPSIKHANIGIGMGVTGTDVTKDVADIILTDDNFSTIVHAVEEGRKIYSNILKIIIYLLSTCIAEIILLFTVITILDLPLFSPAVILWINLIGDTFPCLALGIEKAETGIMKQKPNENRGSLFKGLNGLNIILMGIIEGLIVLSLFLICTYSLRLPNLVSCTACFICLICMEIFHTYNLRDLRNSIFSKNPFSNKFLNITCAVSALLSILLVVAIPINILEKIGLTKISLNIWLLALCFAFTIIPIYEVFKIFVRRYYKKHRN